MKISKHFTSSGLTKGFWLALLGSEWLYGGWAGLDFRPITTFFGLLFFYTLLRADRAQWFWSGWFIGLLWFWWMGVSFIYYHMSWAIPIVLVTVGLVYGGIFWGVAWMADAVARFLFHQKGKWLSLKTFRRGENTPTYAKGQRGQHNTSNSLPALIVKGLSLLTLSYLHPLGFDWFKPELVFVHSYLGITKWQFALVLLAVILTLWRNRPLWLLLSLLAYTPTQVQTLPQDPNNAIKLLSTHTSIADKWSPDKIPDHIREALNRIDEAIASGYRIVVLPESVFPFFLNRRPKILEELRTRSRKIDIVIGALYWDNGTHRNSTYHFHHRQFRVANKVVLVPFGEANPLPQWASKWVNKIFFDGSVDYTASASPTDWRIDGKSYRNAICYEATSERLYVNHPRRMIVTSNNAWFVPSIEPTFQRLLLSYYVRKYGTTIYHASNHSPAYILRKVP